MDSGLYESIIKNLFFDHVSSSICVKVYVNKSEKLKVTIEKTSYNCIDKKYNQRKLELRVHMCIVTQC